MNPAVGRVQNQPLRLAGTDMAEPSAFKYRAFISYSHADTSWAKWLQRGIEGFCIDKDLVGRETPTGTIPKALLPIFRDRSDFTAGHTLTEQTRAALDDSQALIVICSPAAAKSRYVNEEVRLFKSRHPERPVVPLIVAGNPGDPELECFPPSLKFRLAAEGHITEEPIEVLAADAREEADGKNFSRLPRWWLGFSACPPTMCSAARSVSGAAREGCATGLLRYWRFFWS